MYLEILTLLEAFIGVNTGPAYECMQWLAIVACVFIICIPFIVVWRIIRYLGGG